MSKLTWEMEGGDDEISKKRRGEFPRQKPCPKRSKVDLSSFLSNVAQSNRINAAAIGNENKTMIQQNGLSGKQRPVVKKPVCVLNSDADSEDEIRMLVSQEHSKNPKQTSAEDDDDNLEVVGDDFVVKSNAFWSTVEQDGKKSLLTTSKEDEDYDSADTDEILTQRKTQKTQVDQDSPTKSSKNKSSSESDGGSDEVSDDDVSIDSEYEAMMGKCCRLELSLADLEQLAKNTEVISDDESVEEPKEEIKTPSAPLKRRGINPEDILASLFKGYTPDKESKNQVTKVSLPAFIGTKDLFGGPEPILKRVAQSIDCESPKRLKQDLNLKEQSVSEDTSQPQSSTHPSQQKLSNLKVQSTSKKLENQSSENDSSSEESETSEEGGESAEVVTLKSPATQSVGTITETKLKTVSSNNSNTPVKPKKTNPSRSSSSDSESSEEEDNEDSSEVITSKMSSVTPSIRTNPETKLKTVNSNIKPKKTNPSRTSSSDSSSEESETSDDGEKSRTQPKDSKPVVSKKVQEKVETHPTVLHSTVIDAQKQQKDNQKRLAALEQRQKETEQQKKLIQGALSSVVSRTIVYK